MLFRSQLVLCRALLHQGRYDQAEQVLLERLNHICGLADRDVLQRHLDVLRELFAARGNSDKDAITLQLLQQLMPDDPVLQRFSGVHETRDDAPTQHG